MITLKKIFLFVENYCNTDELVFDVVIAASAYYLYGSIIHSGENILSSFKPNSLFSILLLIEFIIISYLGMLYHYYMPLIYISSILSFIIKFIYFIIITGLYLGMLISIPLFKIIPQNSFGKDIEFILVFALCVPFIIALLTAFPKDSKKEVSYLFYVPIMIMIPTLPMMSFSIAEKTNWGIGILSFPLMILMLFIPELIFFIFKSLPLKENLNIILIKKIFSFLIFPIFVSLALTFWQEITLHSAIQTKLNNHMKLTQNFLIASLFFSGLIPVRIIAAFAPPYKLLNTLIAIASFAYYIHLCKIEYVF